jgi:hypothetical protein
MICNLTQHAPTPEQVAAGVSATSSLVQALLTFSGQPTWAEVERRAEELAGFADDFFFAGAETRRLEDGVDPLTTPQGPRLAMIGGAPWFMRPLELALVRHHIEPVYSFSERHSVDEPQADGSVRKVNVFRHVGFIRPEGLL